MHRFLLIVVGLMLANVSAADSIAPSDGLHSKAKAKQTTVPTGEVPLGCLTYPFPLHLHPDEPRWTTVYTYLAYGGFSEAEVVIWRKPCSPTTSVVMVTLIMPSAGSICPFWTVTQGDEEYKFANPNPSITESDKLCKDLSGSGRITTWLDVRTLPGNHKPFDPNASFRLVENGFLKPLGVGAYDPAAYDFTPQSATITKDYSGSWLTPGATVTNQGWALVFNEEYKVAAAYWFTGSLDGKTNEWFTAAGDYSGDTAVMDLHKTTGVTFAGSTGTSVPFGKLTIEFENCSSGLVTYNMNDGRKGSLPMTRLIPAPEGCK